MDTSAKVLTWAKHLCSHAPLVGAHIRRAACQKLATDGTAQSVPFLVSALASSDEEVRRMAHKGLESLKDPEAIDALQVGYLFTENECICDLLNERGCTAPDADQRRRSQEARPEQSPRPTDEVWQYHNSKDDTRLAFVPEGDFLAGLGRFRVHLPAYYLALTCVTNAQYAQFLTDRRASRDRMSGWMSLEQSALSRTEDGAYAADPDKADRPVIWVTWEGAAAYCKWAGLRLPSELEWEKGARGVDGRMYPWGDEWEMGRPLPPSGEPAPEEITSVCAYSTARSPYGHYQMIGNVFEWCADWYEEGVYERYARGDTKAPSQGEHRVLRGGPWRFGPPAYLRTEYRKSTVWRGGTLLCGFRCAKSL